MPITVSLPSRSVDLVFPDSMTDQEIQEAIEKEYPRSGQDVAFEVQQATQGTIEGNNLVNPFDAMSNDDYILYRKHLAEKKTSFGDALGIATDTFSNIINDVGTGIGAAAYKTYEGEYGKVAESAKKGVIAGTIGLADIAAKILDPANPIPSKEDFLNQTKDQPQETIADETFPFSFGRKQVPNTEQDYNALIEGEKARDRDITNRLFAMEAALKGAPIEEVARGAQYLDPTVLAGGASALLKAGTRTLFKTGARTAARTTGRAVASTAPGPIGQAALGAVERGAGAVQSVTALPGQAIQAVGNVAESVLPGTGMAAKGAAITGAAFYDAGIPLAASAATSKLAETAQAAARAARGEASRASSLERAAMRADVSPAARKLAAGLAQIQPITSTLGRVTGQALKEGAQNAAIGAGLGYLAERSIEGAAAGSGAGFAFGGMSGAFRSAFGAGKEALGYSTARTARQAVGDINTFIGERPQVEQAAWLNTFNRLVDQVGPEKAAAQADALRIAEANGASVRVATPDEVKQWQNPGWMNVDGTEVVLNPTKILGDTAAHETAHVLFASTINRAFKPEIETAIFGIVDPTNGQIIRPGIFNDVDLAKISDQIADSYGKNTTASNEFRGYANRLRNTTDAAALSEARTRIADELTATYTGKMFGRLRAGRFNPDRLPLVYRRVLNSIEDGIVDKFRTVLMEQGQDLGFNRAAGAFVDSRGRKIRIPELDAVIKKAMQPRKSAMPEAKAKPDLIPVNPADRAVWLRTYGGAQGIVNSDGTPKSVSQINAEATARWQDMTSRLAALSDAEKIGLQFSRDSTGKAVMTAKGQLSDAAINTILSSGALDQSSVATLREVLNSLKNFDKATFDTRYYGVYTRGRGGNKMVAGVKSASQNEILPYSVEVNSKDGVLIRAVDMSKVRDRLMTAMNKPQFKDLYGNAGDALKDFKAYLTNLTNVNAVPSEVILGGGVKGAQKRNLFYDALGFRLRNGETLVNAPAEVISRSKDVLKSYRVERFAKLVDTGERLAFEEATTYERAMKNFQPSAFVRETLPNGETLTNPDGYRILKKVGSKLYRVYDDKGELIGTTSTENAAMRKGQDDFAKKVSREEPAMIRFQFAGESAELPQFMRDSLEAAKAMAKEGKTSEVIRAITGWFPGKYDDKMRWEVPDQKARLNVEPFLKSVSGFKEAKLGEVLDHPSLFAAYPEAKEIFVSAEYKQPGGSFWKRANGEPAISLSWDVVDPERAKLAFERNPTEKNRQRMESNRYEARDEMLSTLLHEVQHWIQDKEGFARGSSPQMFEKPAGLPRHIINNALDIAQSAIVYKMTVAQLKQNPPKRLQYLPEESWYLAENNDIKKLLAEHELSNRSANPEDAYRRTAGEIESRDVQARQSFTPEQRKAIAPYSSENIAREEAIVLKSAKKASQEERQTRFQPISPEQDAAYLSAVKAGDNAAAQRMVDDKLAKIGAYWHGTPSGDLRGGITGLHVGTRQAAIEALEARIGIPADGKGWDGTREYGKTLLAGKNRINSGQFGKYRLSGYNVDAPVDDYFPTKMPTVGNGIPVDPKWKPWIRPVLIVGEMTNTPRNPISDQGANRRIKRKKGAFYINTGEDFGSISAVLPSGESVRVKLADPVTYDDKGNVIPISKRFNPETPDIRFQPDQLSPNIQVGSNGTRIIKSPSGKFRVYSATGALLGIRDTEETAKKLATK